MPAPDDSIPSATPLSPEDKAERARNNRRNRAYVRRLLTKWTEPQIRQMLQACAAKAHELLAIEILLHQCDLESDPLTKIISPYDMLGFHFRIQPHPSGTPSHYRVRYGRSYHTVGDGGIMDVLRHADGTLQIEHAGSWKS